MSRLGSVFRRNVFKDKVAIVTGGGTGIGRAITQELSYLGCNVVVASRNEERLRKAAEEMNALLASQGGGDDAVVVGRVTPIPCNIRKEEQVKSLLAATLSRFGKLDFLVNNGGGQFPSPAADMSLKGWNAVIETNLTGTFLVSREAFNAWMKEHGGAMVNIIADMWRGFPTMAHTGAARSAVDNLTKSLSVEWADCGVRVNAVAPGIIYSDTAASNYSVDVFAAALPGLPARRCGTPEEVSAAVCFLLSPAASYISGASLRVDCAGSLYGPLLWPIAENHEKLPPPRWTDDDDDPTKGGKIPPSKL